MSFNRFTIATLGLLIFTSGFINKTMVTKNNNKIIQKMSWKKNGQDWIYGGPIGNFSHNNLLEIAPIKQPTNMPFVITK